jgi:hypothetical protein
MNVFCITSTINVSNNPWSYINIRTIWSAEERLNQTISQIKSIRKYCPNSFIILSEGSILTEEQKEQIVPLADVFLNDISDKKIYDAIHKSNMKGLGESYELLAGINFVISNNIKFNLFFKFGGRFSLNNNFNINNFSLDKLTFKYQNEYNCFKTILYSIPFHKLKDFRDKLEFVINDIPSLIGIEYIYPKYYTEYQDINILGIEGWMGITREYAIA